MPFTSYFSENMNAENDLGEFSGDLEREDKAFILDLVVRECFREWDSLDKSQYKCAQQCVICSGKNAHELESIASVDFTDGLNFTFPFEKRKILISQLVHEFFEKKWKAKQLENKLQRMLSFKGSLLEKDRSTLVTDVPTYEDRVPHLHKEIKLDEPLETLQTMSGTVTVPECSGSRKAKTVKCSKLYKQTDIQLDQVVKKRNENSIYENRELIIYGSGESSKNTSLKRSRNKTKNNIPRDKIIDIDMENKHCSNKKPKLLKNTFLENLDRLVHLKKNYNSYFAAKTEEEIDFLKGIPENLLRKANDQEKYNRNECVKSTNVRYSADLRKPKPPYYTIDDRSSNNKCQTDHRKPNPKYYTRGDSSRNNKYPAGNPKTTYVNEVVSSHNICIEKKFQFRPHDGLKPEYKNTRCFDVKVERPPDKAESVVCLLVNDTPAAFAIDQQKGKIS